ncbi:hypothetical protein AB8Z38_07395 [Bradyrhizobium sp. LLZ17]|uniref:Uncharacterized protein n=1 Tax=Bradyrhizobium sp. LLZ17 TaxID=3239388 RepID=A0AB39XNC0_9BRAD
MSNDPPREPVAAMLIGLSPQEAEALRRRVFEIARDLGDSSQQDQFVRAVDEAIGEHRFYTGAVPSDQRGIKLARSIEKAATALARDLGALDRITASVLVQKIWLSKNAGRLREEAISLDDLDKDVKRLRLISGAASALIEGGGMTVRIDGLVRDIARGYADSFKVTPSYSRSGLFAKLIKETFRSARITPVPDESRLKSALSGMKFLDAALPRRGRKTKLNTTKSG